jgi:hypothetical protein
MLAAAFRSRYDVAVTRSMPRAVGDILGAAVPALARRLVEVDIRRAWSSIAGPDAARRARPGALVGDCLQITVDNSPWCQEITLRAPALVAALAERFGPDAVRSVRVTIGALPPESGPASTEPGRPARRASVEELSAIGAILAPITDRGLAESLRRLLVKTGRFERK